MMISPEEVDTQENKNAGYRDNFERIREILNITQNRIFGIKVET